MLYNCNTHHVCQVNNTRSQVPAIRQHLFIILTVDFVNAILKDITAQRCQLLRPLTKKIVFEKRYPEAVPEIRRRNEKATTRAKGCHTQKYNFSCLLDIDAALRPN